MSDVQEIILYVIIAFNKRAFVVFTVTTKHDAFCVRLVTSAGTISITFRVIISWFFEVHSSAVAVILKYNFQGGWCTYWDGCVVQQIGSHSGGLVAHFLIFVSSF